MTWMDQVAQVAKSQSFIVGTASVLSFAAGAGSAYLFLKERISDEYEQLAEREIAEAREYYQVKKEDFQSPGEALAALSTEEEREALRAEIEKNNYDNRDNEFQPPPVTKRATFDAPEEVVEEVATPVVEVNIFANSDAVDPNVFDYDAELASRDENFPYVISAEEYNDSEPGYTQIPLTWYEQDLTLADDQDKSIDVPDIVIGDENLQKFGHGSGDKDVVYIRNSQHRSDYEVTRSRGSYVKEVLGIDEDHLEHSDRRRPRRTWADE